MGLIDQLESMAGGGAASTEHASVTRELLSAVSEHPGGVGGLLDQFRQNGLGNHVDSWVQSTPGDGATPAPVSQQQVEQGVPAGLLQRIGERTGLPPQVVTTALTTALPLVMQHLTPGGQVPMQAQGSGLAQELMSKFL